MKTKAPLVAALLLAIAAIGSATVMAQTPLSNAFTYQGQLREDGEIFPWFDVDLVFRLYDAAAGGALLDTDTRLDVPVNDGLFTTEVLFNAADAFNGEARWIEVSVNGTPVSPRQPVTATPFAVYALNAVGSGSSLWTQSGSNIYYNSGNVGIATTAPAAKLDVNGLARVRGAGWPSGGAGMELAYTAASPPTTPAKGYIQVYDRTTSTWGDLCLGNGNVGIGTTSPDAKLHVAGDMMVDTPESGAIEFRADEGPVGSFTPGINIVNGLWNTLRLRRALEIWPNDAGTMAGYFDVRDSNGVPQIALNGADGRVTTNILEITGGSDLSEQFDIAAPDDQPQPGMVVCIDPEGSGRLVVSTRAYDRTVAGVISGAGGIQTGMLMGQKGSAADGKQPVALSGRVYVLCDASAGPIQPGDLLTTANTPGHAMRVIDYPRAQGAIIGKAMTSLDSGEGLVLVLVSLQ